MQWTLFILRFRRSGARGWLGELSGAPGAAAELAQDAPGFELGIGAFAGSAQPGMSPAGLFLRGGLVPPPARREALTGTTAHAVLFTFRLLVRHQTQESPAVFLPSALGMPRGASWRTDVPALRRKPSVSVRGSPRSAARGRPLAAVRRRMARTRPRRR